MKKYVPILLTGLLVLSVAVVSNAQKPGTQGIVIPRNTIIQPNSQTPDSGKKPVKLQQAPEMPQERQMVNPPTKTMNQNIKETPVQAMPIQPKKRSDVKKVETKKTVPDQFKRGK
jgi:hypothetical protein